MSYSVRQSQVPIRMRGNRPGITATASCTWAGGNISHPLVCACDCGGRLERCQRHGAEAGTAGNTQAQW